MSDCKECQDNCECECKKIIVCDLCKQPFKAEAAEAQGDDLHFCKRCEDCLDDELQENKEAQLANGGGASLKEKVGGPGIWLVWTQSLQSRGSAYS